MFYYVCGINGTGKSTLVHEITKKTNYLGINCSEELIKFLNIEKDYEELRNLNYEYVNKQFSLLINKLLGKFKNETVLFDSHLLNLVNGEIVNNEYPWLRRFGAIVLVKSEIKDIERRVKKDNRDRALFSINTKDCGLDILTHYDKLYEEKFNEVTLKYSLPNITIKNMDNRTGKAVNDFIIFDKKLNLANKI